LQFIMDARVKPGHDAERVVRLWTCFWIPGPAYGRPGMTGSLWVRRRAPSRN